ncbi:hypothetical protein G6F24_018361 [Rhizopus arrhizus]|nr:hypothetical protein G6F24_018361 [Rhizopus arrhizus]
MQDPAAGRHSRLRQRQRHVRRWGHTGHGGVDGLLPAGAGLLAGCPVAPSLAGACEPVGQADERGRAGSTGD